MCLLRDVIEVMGKNKKIDAVNHLFNYQVIVVQFYIPFTYNAFQWDF